MDLQLPAVVQRILADASTTVGFKSPTSQKFVGIAKRSSTLFGVDLVSGIVGSFANSNAQLVKNILATPPATAPELEKIVDAPAVAAGAPRRRRRCTRRRQP